MNSEGRAPAHTGRRSLAIRETLDDLLDWAASVLGPSVTVSDRSWSAGSALVLELVDTAGEHWFLKHPRDPDRFDREVRAYESILPPLGDLVPLMAASSAPLQCLLIRAVPGQVATELPPAAAPDVHRAAGAWLARLHASAPPEPAPGRDLGEPFVQHVEILIRRAGDRLEPDVIKFLAESAAEIHAPGDPLTVPCHLDFLPRNWVVDGQGVLRVIDFGHAECDFAVLDLSQLAHRVWLTHPLLQDAFLEGYGRRLGEAEQQTLDRMSVVALVAAMLRASKRRKPDALRRQARLLARLQERAAGR
jgi:Ser/Thr protein kinase RdoA (MazF antagonist)